MTSCDPRRGIEGAYLGDVDDAIVVGEVRVRDVQLDPLLDLLDRGLTGTGMGGTGRSVVRRVGGAESWKMEEKSDARGSRGDACAGCRGESTHPLLLLGIGLHLVGQLEGTRHDLARALFH